MPETFFEKWSNRIAGAWAVLVGRACADYYMTELEYWKSTGPMAPEYDEPIHK